MRRRTIAKLTTPEPSSIAPAIRPSNDGPMGPPVPGSAEAEAVAVALAEALALPMAEALALPMAEALALPMALAVCISAKAADDITSTPTRHNTTNNNNLLMHPPFRATHYDAVILR